MKTYSTDLQNKMNDIYSLFDEVSNGVFILHALGTIIYMNPTIEEVLAVNSDQVLGKNINHFIPDYQFNLVNREYQCYFKFHDNIPHSLLINITSHPLIIENDAYKVVFVKPVQQEKATIHSLNVALSNIKLAINESTIIAVTDPKGNITLVNQKFCELSKYSEEELIGQNHSILNSGYHSKDFFRNMWRTIGNGEVWKGEIRNRAKDGSYYWVETTIVPFLNKKGKPYQYVSIRTDITRRINMERKLQDNLILNYTATMKGLNNGIFKLMKDESGNYIYTMAEGKLMNVIGSNSEILLNKSPYDVYTKDIADLKVSYYSKVFSGERVNYEIPLNGRHLFVDVSPIVRNEQISEIVGTVHDISELKSTQQKLVENQQHYQFLFENSNDYVITLNNDGVVIEMNSKALDLFGYTKEGFPRVKLTDLNIDNYHGLKTQYFQKALNGNPQNFEMELTNHKGIKKFLNVTLIPIMIEKEIRAVFTLGKDITEQKESQELNAYLAKHDELTGLPNRRWFEQKLHDSLIAAEQHQMKLGVLFIDIDRFKYINDTMGHVFGDRLLEKISRRIINTIGEHEYFAARLGGDEFMILCPINESSNEVQLLAKNIINHLTSPFIIEENEIFVTASIGISMYPEAGRTVVDLMKTADIALYQSKDLGRNTYQMYKESMDQNNIQAFQLERDLRKALIKDEFYIDYQPRVDAITGKTVGAEALLRWNHPKLGLVSPCEFIPLAEETGLIVPIGKWVKRNVCKQLVKWREAGSPMIPISVNISAQRFLQRNFAQEVRILLEEFELEGKWLELEITENSIMKNEQYIIQTIQELKMMGIKIYIDDFGTGYSSFNYLKTFQLDGIKIDRSFVQNLSNTSENAGITAAMIKVAKQLKMDVIAEGVETKEELSFLIEHECRYVQGYLFGKPGPIEEIVIDS